MLLVADSNRRRLSPSSTSSLGGKEKKGMEEGRKEGRKGSGVRTGGVCVAAAAYNAITSRRQQKQKAKAKSTGRFQFSLMVHIQHSHSHTHPIPSRGCGNGAPNPSSILPIHPPTDHAPPNNIERNTSRSTATTCAITRRVRNIGN